VPSPGYSQCFKFVEPSNTATFNEGLVVLAGRNSYSGPRRIFYAHGTVAALNVCQIAEESARSANAIFFTGPGKAYDTGQADAPVQTEAEVDWIHV
jgi:hypothetical protein